MSKKFNIIVADPPWGDFKDKLSMSSVKRGAVANYPVLTTNDICALPIDKIADPDGCVLALWVLGSMLEDGMKVMKAWGFEQKQVFVWIKSKKKKSINKLVFGNIKSLIKKDPIGLIKEVVDYSFMFGDWVLGMGMGRLFRQSHEICLIGINNTKIYKKLANKSQRSVCFDENKGHSSKPEHLQDRLDLMFSGNEINKIEIFARRKRIGWNNIGNEVCDGEDIRISLQKIIENE